MIAQLVALILQASSAMDTPLADPALEARAQAVMREVRCVVCENEPVSQSTADMAVDARRKIRAQIAEGKSDSEVRDFFIQRYGQYVSFRPPTDGWVLLLWIFPFALLVGAGAALGINRFRKRRRDLVPLPDDRGDDGA